MNDRFNIKNGVTENLSNYLPEKCNKKTILAKVWNRSTQQLFLKNSQNSPENTYAKISF